MICVAVAHGVLKDMALLLKNRSQAINEAATANNIEVNQGDKYHINHDHINHEDKEQEDQDTNNNEEN